MTSREERAASFLFAGGGTGGHLYPGIAVARELQRRLPSARIAFAGTARGLEARVVPRDGFALDVLRSTGLKGRSRWARLKGLTVVPLSLADSWRILSRRRPDVVIGVGGYSSGPVVLLAALRGVPTLVLEQNALPGLTNRLLARWVRAAAVAYPEALPVFRGKGFLAGNPVRPEFFAPGRTPRVAGVFRLLILGGSQGAHAINTAMIAAAPALFARIAGLTLVHQTGERDLAEVRAAYARAGVTVRAEAFLDPVADEMKSADVVVGRAGATTLAELAAAGTPAVLVPLPTAADDHQRRNAEAVGRAGAALVLLQADMTPARLVDTVASLASDPVRLARMSEAMRTLARPDAAAVIADRVLALAAGSGTVPAGGRGVSS